MKTSLILLLLIACFPYKSADAMLFGHQENIHKIQDIPHTEYELSYKISTYWFIAGIYLVDDGYVLQKRTDDSKYYLVHSSDEIKNLKKKGLLPEKLPNYSIPSYEYVMGYSLWIGIFFILITRMISNSEDSDRSRRDQNRSRRDQKKRSKEEIKRREKEKRKRVAGRIKNGRRIP